MGLSTPPALPAWRIHFPTTRPPRLASRCLCRPVEGFHTRFVPPPPFPTTLTACASPCPVTFFSHSRPWGCSSLFPVHSRPVSRPIRHGRGRVSIREAPGRPGPASQPKPLRVARSRSVRPKAYGSVPAPLFVTSLRASTARPCSHPKVVHRPSPAVSPPRLPRTGRPRRPTEVVRHQPARLDPDQGLPLPCSLDPRPRVTAAVGRSRRARALSDPLRSRPAALSRRDPFTSAGSRQLRGLVSICERASTFEEQSTARDRGRQRPIARESEARRNTNNSCVLDRSLL
jgi:hypothetical protein